MVRIKTALALLVMVSLLGMAACGDDDGDEGGTTASPDASTTPTTAAGSDEPILIKTHVAPDAQGKTFGEVLSGSTIGGAAFCARGRFIDGPVQIPSRLVLRSFRCPGGTLRITFTSTPPGVEQRSDWKVVNGLGRFKGVSGGGRMRGVLEEAGRGEGRETFTGTVTR